MAITIIHDWTEWLSLDQLRELLRTGKMEVGTPQGTLRLFINEKDRVAAQEISRIVTTRRIDHR